MFALTDRLEVHVDHVRMPAGNGREKTKGHSLDVLSAIKRSIVVVKAAFFWLAYALIIAMARMNNDPKYKLYRNGYGLKEPVEERLKASGVDLFNGGGLKNFNSFNNTFRITKILCLMVCTLIRLCFVEIPFRPRNCTSYMIGTMSIII
jgi:hypothetical protein